MKLHFFNYQLNTDPLSLLFNILLEITDYLPTPTQNMRLFECVLQEKANEGNQIEL